MSEFNFVTSLFSNEICWKVFDACVKKKKKVYIYI